MEESSYLGWSTVMFLPSNVAGRKRTRSLPTRHTLPLRVHLATLSSFDIFIEWHVRIYIRLLPLGFMVFYHAVLASVSEV